MNSEELKKKQITEGEKVKASKNLKCNRAGCEGALDLSNMKVVNGLKRIAKCKVCGAEVKLTHRRTADIIQNGENGLAKRSNKKEFRTKKERRKARAIAKQNEKAATNRIANTGVKYVP